ncbi:hypothetical protein QY97_03940 [Bacillus thermotolerans]|nr:hypothetical protein QY97_03940 [Bacillus thermotolerans]
MQEHASFCFHRMLTFSFHRIEEKAMRKERGMNIFSCFVRIK